MPPSLPKYIGGHALATLGMLILHTSLAAWAMMPEPPVVVPQQQIIKVSMVAPTVIKQDPVPQVEKEPLPMLPAAKGMVKVAPEDEKRNKEEEPEKKEPPEKIIKKQMHTQLTSGLQSREATDITSAITKPMAADYLRNPPPQYPATARTRKQQGTVLLEVLVSTDGAPKSIQIARPSGHTVLDVAALESVRRWKFVPARRGSQTVEAYVMVPVQFKIN